MRRLRSLMIVDVFMIEQRFEMEEDTIAQFLNRTFYASRLLFYDNLICIVQ